MLFVVSSLLLRTGMFSLFLWYDHLSKHSVCFKWQSHQDRRKWGDRSPENKVRKLSHCVLTYCSENVTKLAIMSKNFYENYTLVSSLYIKYFRELFRFFKVHNTDKLSPEILHSIHNLMQVWNYIIPCPETPHIKSMFCKISQPLSQCKYSPLFSKV